MNSRSVLFAAAALGASALSVTIAAAPAKAAQSFDEVVVTGRASDAPQAIVRYADLNLSSERGRARLDSRIDAAADMLCGRPSYDPLTIVSAIKACHSTVQASAKPQVKALFASIDKGERLALGDTAGLTLSAK